MDELGILGLRLRSKLRFGFLRPVGDHLLAQLADLFDGSSFRFVRRATFRDRSYPRSSASVGAAAGA
jgi:hypothetical protein